MVQRLICYASVLCLSVRLVSASDQQTGVAQPATSSQAQAASVDEKGQELNSQGSPIDQLRQLADQFEAGAVGELADRMRATSKQLREMADQLEQDVAERLTYLRDDRNRIQLEIDRLSQMAKSTEQVLLNIKVVELDRTQLRRYGLDMQVIFHGDDARFWGVEGQTGSAVTFAVTANEEFRTRSSRRALIMDQQSSGQGAAKVLAEPRLVTTSGRPATLHSGGEFPILIPKEVGEVNVKWREFGVRAEILPIILENGRVKLTLHQRS
ncbi:MAG: hypothetical protein R3B91_02820 [Planctomycetaceae bacterium]